MSEALTIAPANVVINYAYNYPLAGFASGFVAYALIKEICKIAGERFAQLKNLSDFFAASGAAFTILICAYVPPMAVFLVTITALIILKIKNPASLKGEMPKYLTNLSEAARLDIKDGKPPRKYVGYGQMRKKAEAIIYRKECPNIFITGPAGAGKTTFTEMLAEMSARGQFSPASPFHGKEFFKLSMSKFLGGESQDEAGIFSGTIFRGQLGGRINQLFKFLDERPNAILVLDEGHMMMGSTGIIRYSPSEDMSEILKSFLERGKYRWIALTTDLEYERFVALNPPLAQRFDRLSWPAPTEELCYYMFSKGRENFSRDYLPGLTITDEGIAAAIICSNQYRQEKSMPRGPSLLIQTIFASVDLGRKATENPSQEIEITAATVVDHYIRFSAQQTVNFDSSRLVETFQKAAQELIQKSEQTIKINDEEE